MNNYAPLPDTLKAGMKLACPLHYDPPQVITVAKVYDDGRVLLVREDGNRAFVPLDVKTLKGYDYQLLTEGTTP